MDLEDLKKKKLDDLRAIAKMFGVKSVTTKNKAQLIEAMQNIPEQEEVAKTEAPVPAQSKEPEAKPEAKPEEKPDEKPAAEEKRTKTPEDQKKEKRNPGKNQNNKNQKHKEKKKQSPAPDKDATATEHQVAEVQPAEAQTTETSAPEATSVAAEAVPAQETPQPAPQPAGPVLDDAQGILEILPDNYGFLRCDKYTSDAKDTYVPPTLIRKFNLKTGDYIKGKSKFQRENDKYQALCYINTVNDDTIDVAMKRKPFESLTPIYPDSKIVLETVPGELSTRIIDLIAPIGKGQRGMIVSPPKAGKTILLKKIANAITENYPDIKLIVLLIDERPEEVTDMRESVEGDVISSTFDEMPEKHIKVAEMVFERAQRMVEHGKDVVILMDSLTRLARAYNITIPPTGRSLSGGLDPGALYKPKRFFGAARNIRDGGSLTIIATALIDTGSKMDDVIFEEFKGTGNMELHLDRKLSEKRVFPAIDINKSGTRKEELLLTEDELNRVYSIRKALSNAATAEVTEMIVNKMLRTKNNEEFLKTINIIAADK